MTTAEPTDAHSPLPTPNLRPIKTFVLRAGRMGPG